MILESIEAYNFRNLSGTILWGSGLNIIYGNNGQGKTNWLEGIYILARTKSFRTQRLQESIKFGEIAFISGHVFQWRTRARLAGDPSRQLKINLVNGKREALARYLSQLQVFSFTAAELEVVRGIPEARRRFFDPKSFP